MPNYDHRGPVDLTTLPSIQNTRAERTQRHQRRPQPRRQGTRAAVIAAARQEA